MKRAIEVLNSPNNNYTPFTLEVKAPGTLRTILTGYEPPSTIIPASMGKPPEAEMKPLPALVFEVDPDGEPHKRSFVWLPAGKALEFPGALIYAATYVDERTGMPLFLYEAVAA
jgi:hypothetical protein